jgi:large subunit ribosomal protein L17
MRHREHTFKIGRSGAHRKALLANQVSSLIDKGAIKTTLVKAKESRRLAEKMVTLGKKGELHHRRLAISKLRDKAAVAKLFAEIAPKYSNRDGGYTRIVKLGRRVGDAAEMCLLQWVEETKAKRKTKKSDKKSVAEVGTKDTTEKSEGQGPEKSDAKKEPKFSDVKVEVEEQTTDATVKSSDKDSAEAKEDK